MSRFCTPDGVHLNYDDVGAGPVVVCLPGLTRNLDDFEPVVAAFGDRARIVRLDLRGRGGSDWAPPTTYTPAQEAGDVVAFLDHLKVPKAAILGTSRGGLVALSLAAVARPRLTGVFFNDIGPMIERSGLMHILTYLGRDPGYADYDEAAAAMPGLHPDVHGVDAAFWAAYVRRTYRETATGLELRYDPALRAGTEAGVAMPAPLPTLWPQFDALAGLPLALLRGAGSNILSAATAAEMRRRRPDMLFAELPDRGHVPFLDEPGSRDLIAAWLDRLDA
ncbi:MAG: alpha/beta hydrolase [Pseudomonadota bacterium]